MLSKNIVASLAALIAVPGVAAGTVGTVQAATTSPTNAHVRGKFGAMGHRPGNGQNRPVAFGTISTINGASISITDAKGTAYTIDTTNAKILSGPNKNTPTTAPTLANLKTGDSIAVLGTLNGTTITATAVLLGGIPHGMPPGGPDRGPGISGKVTAVSGTTLTVTGNNNTVYTITAANAKAEKMVAKEKPTAMDVSAIAVGDTVHVMGTLNGTTVTATNIIDGVGMMMPRDGERGEMGHGTMGTVSAISGTTLTVTTRENTAYTVDFSSAKIVKAVKGSAPATITAAGISNGDTVLVQGTVNGTSIAATQIIDGLPQRPAHATMPKTAE